MRKSEEETAAIWGNDVGEQEEYSFSATVVPFDPPLPLLRGPFPASPADDPSAGAFVLAFAGAASWRSAYASTESKIMDQCMAGARVGCSISASNKCKPPWWTNLFGASVADYAEREQCEEREMSSCLAASRDSCERFAKEKCLPPFRDARIAIKKDWNGAPPLAFFAPDVATADALDTKVVECEPEDGNYRGSSLLEDSSA